MRRVGLWKRIAAIGVTASMLLTNVSPGFADEVLEASAETTAQELETVSIESAVEGSEDFEAIDDTVLAEEEFSVEEEPTQDEDIILAEDSSENGLASEGIIEEEFLNAAEGEMATVTWDAGEGTIQNGGHNDEETGDWILDWSSSKEEDYIKGDYLLRIPYESELKAPEGTVFGGWLLNGEPISFEWESEEDEGHYNYLVEDDVTFTASWKEAATVTWDAGEGFIRGEEYDEEKDEWVPTLDSSRKDVYAEGDYLDRYPDEEELKAPAGKAFAGWLLNGDPISFEWESEEDEGHYNYLVEDDVTFTASWKEVATVTWDAGEGTIRIGEHYVDEQGWVTDWSSSKEVDHIKGDYLDGYPDEEELKAPDGKVFAGWLLNGEPISFHWESEDDDEDEGHYDYLVEDNVIFTASWKEAVTVTWNAGEGFIRGEEYDEEKDEWVPTLDSSRKDVYAEGDYLDGYPDEEELKAPDGKVFAGWLLNGKPFKFTWNDEDDHCNYQVTGNVTFTASWKEAVTVTWDAGEGTIQNGEYYDEEKDEWVTDWSSYKEVEHIKGNHLLYIPGGEELKAPDGKAFAGWLLNGKPIEFTWNNEEDGQDGHYDYQVTDKVTFTASWKKAVTVTWDAGEGFIRGEEYDEEKDEWVPTWDSSRKDVYAEGAYLTRVPSEDGNNIQPPEGKDFAGWLLNGEPIVFASAGSGFDWHYDYLVNDDVTFTAVYGDSVNITWDAGIGSFRTYNPETGKAEDVRKIEETQAKGSYIKQRYPEELKNYEFIGWSTDGTEANIVDFGWDFEKRIDTYIVEEEVDFIAVWKRAYNITIDSNGPTWFYDENGRRTTVSTSARCILGNHFSPSWRVPTENLNSQYQGHTLLGWSKTRDGKVVIPVNGGSEVPTGDTTYYAVWHNIVNDPAVAATETSTGKTAGSHCSVCGKVFVAQKVIPKRPAKPTDKITITKTPSGVKAKAAKKGKATLTWKKFKQTKKTKATWKKIKKIEVQYSTDKNFKTGVISKTLGKKKTKLTVKKLKAKTTYYFRVRYVEGPYKVSKWSSAKKVKAKK